MSSILNEEDIILTGFPRRQRDPDQRFKVRGLRIDLREIDLRQENP